jgi:nucleoside-diphosphate-sugar epimerase
LNRTLSATIRERFPVVPGAFGPSVETHATTEHPPMSLDEPRDVEEPTAIEPNGSSEPPEFVAFPSGLRILDQNDLESDPEVDPDGFDQEEEPRTVLITGACGNIGRKLRDAWQDLYDLVLIDREAPPSDIDVIVADLAEWDESWVVHFDNVDTVVHLAADPNEFASWEELMRPNVDAMANVFHASAFGGVERVIFASSNHAMGGYRDLGDMPITVDLPPRPDGPYGGTKLMGERLGRSLALAFDVTFIALRLGWVQHGENRPETLPDDWARLMWLSNEDLVELFESAVEADLGDRTFLVVNGMSNNRGMRWDLTEAAEWLGYEPADDSGAEVL